MELEFEDVTKFYGPVIGVNQISLRVGSGVTGLLGANGAGKSTLLKLASGQLRPSLGRVKVGDVSAWSTEAKRRFGFSPDVNSFYESMSGRDFVWTMTRLYGYSRAEARRRTDAALETVGMAERGGRKLGACSHGMRQRVKLAQALVHDPPILLLDEPLTGIDPGGRREFKRLLRTLSDQGKSILVSTHVLGEVEGLADSIALISRGRLIAHGAVDEVRQKIENEPLTIEVESADARRLAALLVESGAASAVELRGDRFQARAPKPQAFFRTLGDLTCEHQFQVRRVQVLDAGADAVFGYLTGKGGR